jgi:hypothetical protein
MDGLLLFDLPGVRQPGLEVRDEVEPSYQHMRAGEVLTAGREVLTDR